MNTINAQVYEEASEWIVRHRTGSLDGDAKRRFDAWLRESPQHVRAYLEMSSLWEDVPALDPNYDMSADKLIARARADVNVLPLNMSASAAAMESGQTSERHSTGRKTRTHAQSISLLAASLLLVVGISGWFYLQRGVYSTDIGEQRTVVLTDGSVVELNSRSKIKVDYTDHERAVDLLHGQALFRVAKDPKRPFTVESDETLVRAIGTQFDVYKRKMGTVVTVVEGRVAVLTSARDVHTGDSSKPKSDLTEHRPAGTANMAERTPGTGSLALKQVEIAEPSDSLAHPEPVYLIAGEQLVVEPTAITAPKPTDVEAVTAWTQQRLVFDFTPLTEVAEEFNRYNRRPLVIDDSNMNEFNVSGSFSSTDPALLLRFLRAQPGIAVHETDREIRISRQKTDGA